MVHGLILRNTSAAHVACYKKVSTIITERNEERNSEIRYEKFQKQKTQSLLRAKEIERSEERESIWNTQQSLWAAPRQDKPALKAELENKVSAYESKHDAVIGRDGDDFTSGCSCTIL